MSKINAHEKKSPQSRHQVEFLIITALQEERDAVLRQLGDCKTIQEANSPTYYRTSVKAYSGSDYEVAVTMLTQTGNVSAAVHTTQAIHDLKPTYMLMVGIAGGIKGEVKLGDVVISEQIIYYEYTKEKPTISDLRPQVIMADLLLLDRAKNYRDINWHSLIKTKRPNSPEGKETPQVHFSPVASGEKVIADGLRANDLKRLHSKLSAIEMESFGAALAAARSDNRPRFLAIRGISDYADCEKNDDWHEYAADSAAAFTVGFLRSGAIPAHKEQKDEHLTRKTLVVIRHHSMEPLSSRLISTSLPPHLREANMVELEINQTDLYDNGQLTNPVKAVRRQMDLTRQLSNALDTYPDVEIAYYGIAHIPLLFLAGCQLLNRRPLQLFEHNRRTDRWDQLQRGGDFPEVKLEGLPIDISQKSGDVIVRISVSYPIYLEAIEGIVTDPIASLHLSIDQPKRDVVTSDEQIRQYSAVFRDMLDEIHNKLPNTKHVHLFYAGPVALAVNLGRQISKPIHPRIIVYNYSSKDDPPGYAWGLEVTGDVNSPDFLVRTRG